MGVKALGYVVIETAQPEKWEEFLTRVVGAMRAPDASDGAALYRIDERAFRFRIVRGERERLLAAGYEVANAEMLAALEQAVRLSGRPVESGSAEEVALRGVSGFFKTSDPAGNGLEFFCCDTVADSPFQSPLGVPEFITGDMGMGHAVFSAPNFDDTVAFYRNVIGFHETDMPRFHLFGPDGPSTGFAFMHADNGRHHSIAIAEGPVPPSGAVHLMVEMPDLIEVGKAHDRMKALGYAESATLGRHVNDETTGFYVQTPGGFDLEIGCDSLVIDPASWVTTRHEAISTWGHEWAWQKAMKEAQQ
ncbi:iron-dependent extradiol dioxygenase [Novosphingobium endophyticum]|uniref:Iron-dependent extradiol dioxygenase n=1 Tax=Novosphingobium endophyticum TaxID=1955250 RepID=A0A916TTL0_9SPHN|nr:VOC family protein [Novosphingobium endophyticum]GGC06923.1 iron-dependent extradiol dioxygenase [Novosphingobium endophyticum]